MKLLKWILISLGLIILLGASGFSIWAYTPAQPMPEALQALNSNVDLAVNTLPGWIEFKPHQNQPTTGLILYPGGRVDYRAYAPLAREIAANGYLVILTHMPFNLAVTQPGKASDVIKSYPTITTWTIGGHSLGGAMAANFTYNNPQVIKGLVLWAAYPAGSDALVDLPVQVISISGSRDGLATKEKIEDSRKLLPPSARFVVMEGGNHAQFGYYGEQAGDLPAQIDRAAQQQQILKATLEWLNSIESSR